MSKTDENNDELNWLIWSNQHGAWWMPDGNGYTNDRSKAGRYTLADANGACEAYSPDKPTRKPEEVMVPSPEYLAKLPTVVNSHAALVAACKAALELLDKQRAEHNAALTVIPVGKYVRGPIAEQLAAALSAAKEEKE